MCFLNLKFPRPLPHQFLNISEDRLIDFRKLQNRELKSRWRCACLCGVRVRGACVCHPSAATHRLLLPSGTYYAPPLSSLPSLARSQPGRPPLPPPPSLSHRLHRRYASSHTLQILTLGCASVRQLQTQIINFIAAFGEKKRRTKRKHGTGALVVFLYYFPPASLCGEGRPSQVSLKSPHHKLLTTKCIKLSGR